MQLFKSNRADVFKRGMSPNPVIEVLYALEDGLSGLCARVKEREIHALTLECSDEEIAEQLVIAISTVKRHVSNIFGKLAVSNRTQAVTRAQTIGLL